MKKVTVKLYLDTRSRKKGWNSVVKVMVTLERVQRLYTTNVIVSEQDWTKLQRNIDKHGLSSKLRDKHFVELYQKLYDDDSAYSKANKIVEKLGGKFSFEDFKYQFDNFEKTTVVNIATNDAIAALFAKSTYMDTQDRVGNALNYELAAKSIARFVNSLSDDERYNLGLPIIKHKSNLEAKDTRLPFDFISVDLLCYYEKWMLKFGKTSQKKGGLPTPASLTTVGIYLRHLRSVFNDAIEGDVIDRKQYPFTKKGYVIPAGSNNKQSLKKSDIEKIINVELTANSMKERSRDLWIFSYLSNGMNMSDICHLKWKDIDLRTNKLKFIRMKTTLSKKGNQTEIEAILFPQSIAILERWGNKLKKMEDFVFPFIDDSMNVKRQKAVIRQVIKVTNEYMNQIGKELGIDGDLNTYSARHSFATILLRSNAPLAFISKSMGHTNIKTTESYLGSFEDEQVQEYLKVLV